MGSEGSDRTGISLLAGCDVGKRGPASHLINNRKRMNYPLYVATGNNDEIKALTACPDCFECRKTKDGMQTFRLCTFHEITMLSKSKTEKAMMPMFQARPSPSDKVDRQAEKNAEELTEFQYKTMNPKNVIKMPPNSIA